MQHRHQRADLMRSGPSGPSARPSQDLCRRSRAMASAASARSARSALALATLALVSGHVFSGTAASAQISGDIRSIFPCFPNAEMLLLHLKFQGISRLSINFVWLRLAEQVLVACFFCDRSCLTGTFAANRQAVNRSGRLPRSAQTDPNFAANVGAPRPEDSLLSRNANKYPSNIHQISQRISTSLSAVWMI